jgi:hypothetical protein
MKVYDLDRIAQMIVDNPRGNLITTKQVITIDFTEPESWSGAQRKRELEAMSIIRRGKRLMEYIGDGCYRVLPGAKGFCRQIIRERKERIS